MFTLAAEYDAAAGPCSGDLGKVRDEAPRPVDADPLAHLVEHFGARLDRPRSLGVDRVIIDPGMGFYYANLTDPTTRVRHQARVLAQSFRLRPLGVPVCNALPHAFDLLEDKFRKAEGFFAVMGSLGGTQLFRTHEVAHVRTVLAAMAALAVGGGRASAEVAAHRHVARQEVARDRATLDLVGVLVDPQQAQLAVPPVAPAGRARGR